MINRWISHEVDLWLINRLGGYLWETKNECEARAWLHWDTLEVTGASRAVLSEPIIFFRCFACKRRSSHQLMLAARAPVLFWPFSSVVSLPFCLLARVVNREWLGLGVAGTLRSDFFREEYVLDYRLANIAKEQVILSPPNLVSLTIFRKAVLLHLLVATNDEF